MTADTRPGTSWPPHLRPGALGLPGTETEMEIVRARGDSAATGSFDQLVFYLDDATAVAAADARLRDGGFLPVVEPHPYWAANGAVTYRDPDGRDVVFAPWVFGRDPEPSEDGRPDRDPARGEQRVAIDRYSEDRAALRSLFEEAEDSQSELDGYIDAGLVLVARLEADLVGHLQLVRTDRPDIMELKNMAVTPGLRGSGIGRSLVEAGLAWGAQTGVTQMVVATAAADVDNLRFYQRCGFRLTSVERDAFTRERGYPDAIDIDGIPLRDRVWLDRRL
jgi:GNAT superfamily N-acetyltransferase